MFWFIVFLEVDYFDILQDGHYANKSGKLKIVQYVTHCETNGLNHLNLKY